VGQLSTGAIIEPAAKYQRISQTYGVPRHNH
jgi:dihydroxy-acid dehydratase